MRFDPLADLLPSLRAALAAAARAPLPAGDRAHDPRTIHALARRGLLRLHCDRFGAQGEWRPTEAGKLIARELSRRAAARARLIAENPARALPPLPAGERAGVRG